MQIEQIALSDLLPPVYPVRRVADDDEMESLIHSISTIGLLHPLTVVREEKKYRILAGHRRFIALKALGRTSVPCNIIETSLDSRGAITVEENLVRESVNPVDLGYYFKHLIEDEGQTQAEIGERMGRGQSWVSRFYRLTFLEDDVQVAVQRGDLPARGALELSRIKDVDTRHTYTRDALLRGSSGPQIKNTVDAYMNYEHVIDKALQDAQGVRDQVYAEVEPLRCAWCGAKASDKPGDMVWLCGECVRNLLSARTDESMVAAGDNGHEPEQVLETVN